MRGGRLKERDPLFELVLKWITHSEYDMTLSMREAVARAETLIEQVRNRPNAHLDVTQVSMHTMHFEDSDSK